jgi:hypothetical protein
MGNNEEAYEEGFFLAQTQCFGEEISVVKWSGFYEKNEMTTDY